MTEAVDNQGLTHDDGWHVLVEVVRLAFPMILGYASSTIMHFVDARMVSCVGGAALAAVGSAGVLVFTATALAFGVTSCVNTFASQSLGRGRVRECSSYAWQNAFFSIGVGLLAAAAMPAVPRVFAWVGHDPDVQACEVSYGRIRLLGMGFMVAGWGFCSYFQGIHRPWVTTTTTFAANLVNVGANYVLIFGHLGFPRLGVAGAAWGTVFASGLQCAMMVAAMIHPRHAKVFGGLETCRIDWVKFRQLLHIGWPAGVNFFLDIASWAIFTNFLIGRFGRAALAGNMVAMQYMHLSFMPALGLSNATAALVGKYLGQRDVARARQRAYMALRVAVVYMLSMGMIFYCFRHVLAGWFSDDGEVVRHAATFLVFAAIFQGFDAFGIVSSGALRGAGDTHWTAGATVACCWGVFMPVAALLTYCVPWLGAKGPWVGATIYICLLGVALFCRLLSARWTKIDIFRDGRSSVT